MPCMNRVYRDKKASVHWSAARRKERFSSRGQTAVQPMILFPYSVYIGFRLFVLLGKRGDVSSMLWRVRGRLVSWANNSVGIQSCPTPPRHPAVRSVPTRQWYVRVLDSTGREDDDRSFVCGQEQLGVCILDKRNTIIFWPKESAIQFPGKTMEVFPAKRFQLEVAPSTAGQKRVPWIPLCGSLHSGSTNSGSLHTARSP